MITEEFLTLFMNHHLGTYICFLMVLISIWINPKNKRLYDGSSKYIKFKSSKNDYDSLILITIIMLPLLIFEFNPPENAFMKLIYFILSVANWVLFWIIIDISDD